MTGRDELRERRERYIDWLTMSEAERLEQGLPPTKQGYADSQGVHVNSLYTWDKREDVKTEVRARLQDRQGSPERVAALLDDLYERGLKGDLKASEQWLKAMGYMRGAAPINEKPASAKDLSMDELVAVARQLVSEAETKAITAGERGYITEVFTASDGMPGIRVN